jgi:glucan biosynthesis protein C
VRCPTHGLTHRLYILHQTVIIVVAHALEPSHLYPPVEGVLLVLVTAAIFFLSREAIRLAPLLRPLQRFAPRLHVPQDIN